MLEHDELVSKLDNLKAYHAKAMWQKESLKDKSEALRAAIDTIEADMLIFEQARIFLQRVSESARKIAIDKLERIVSNALQYVLGPNYSFKVSLRQNNLGRPEADFLVVTKTGSKVVESLPTLGKGGGVIDVLAVALKFAMLEIEDNDGIIWLDEPFKHVSEEYIENAGRLLKFMGETSGRQIIVITHNPRLADMCNKTIPSSEFGGMVNVK